jgi:hypothetical protein
MLRGRSGGRKANDTSASTTKRFMGFAPETDRPVRECEVRPNPFLEKMKNAWDAHRAYITNPVNRRDDYSWLVGNGIENLGNSAEDVETFSILLEGFQAGKNFPYKAGLFLSALINSSKDTEFVIHTAHLRPIDYLGYRNTKNITVDGDIGNWVGAEMESGAITVKGCTGKHVGDFMGDGKIIVEGNAHGFVGQNMKKGSILVMGDANAMVGHRMKDGTIIVKGNSSGYVGYWMEGGVISVGGNVSQSLAGEAVGWNMKNGIVTVSGYAGSDVGQHMGGGEIHLDGTYASISDIIQHGRIFHGRELIVDK